MNKNWSKWEKVQNTEFESSAAGTGIVNRKKSGRKRENQRDRERERGRQRQRQRKKGGPENYEKVKRKIAPSHARQIYFWLNGKVIDQIPMRNLEVAIIKFLTSLTAGIADQLNFEATFYPIIFYPHVLDLFICFSFFFKFLL